MPKLLQICVEGNTGSTGTIAEAIGKIVINNKWESYIAYGRFPRPSISKLIRIGSDWEVILHGIETRLFDRHGLSSQKATKKLVKQIEVIKPDIINLHHLHGYYLNIEILFDFLAKADIPVVWSFHDCWSFTGHCAYFVSAGCEKWKTECNKCPQKKEYPASLIYDRSLLNYYLKKRLFNSVPNMVIVSASNWLDNLVSQSFLKEFKHQVINYGIDLNVFKPSLNHASIRFKYGIANNFIILGVASPWSKRKGFEDYLELSKNLKKDDKIILVGLSKERIKMLPKNILGIGKTENRQDLVDLYSMADVFLNFSVEETFGLTNAEALACGTPVIVYNETACVEVIDSKTGFVVNKKDFNGVLDAIEVIRQNGKLAYADNCRKRAVDLYSDNDRYKEYFDLYEKLIEAKKQMEAID